MARRAGKGRMMHEQAFHTCCKRGLTTQPGFQYNAVSPGILEGALGPLASAHAGYQAPRDAPPEPTIGQLDSFPVSLRSQPVEGIGAVVSRTAYVGREFRAADGSSDTGRFGNYFSHIVVGDSTTEPFDDLLPIELWDAPHWSTRESPDATLHPIDTLLPGPLDLERALDCLLPERSDWIPEVIDATVSAMFGGPRVVVIEEVGQRAAAWVALACFALPRSLSSGLTFSTYEGRPRYSELQLVLTAPSCDTAFPSYELGHQIRLLDTVAGSPDPAHRTLLGAVIGALAQCGAETVSGAARAVGQNDCKDPTTLAAAMAVLARRSDLAREETDIVEILSLLSRWHDSGDGVGLLSATAADIANHPPASSQAVLDAWWNMHARARAGGHPESAELADSALGRLLPNIDLLERPGAIVSCEAAVRPNVARLAEFLDALQEPMPSGPAGRRLAAGWRLGLLGVNDELDRRFAATLAEHLEDSEARSTFTSICAEPRHDELVRGVVSTLLEHSADDSTARSTLTALSAEPALRDAVTSVVRTSDSFNIWLAGARLELGEHPHRRRAFVTRLAELADTDRETDMVRALYGPAGPKSGDEHAELIEAYTAASRVVPAEDLTAGWRAIAAVPFSDPWTTELERLAETLDRADPLAGNHAVYVARKALVEATAHSSGAGLEQLVSALRYAATRPQELSDDRYLELVSESARLILSCERPEEQRARFVDAMEAVGEDLWIRSCEAELARGRLARPESVARLFTIWVIPPPSYAASGMLVMDGLLADVVERLTSGKRRTVEEALPERYREMWLAFGESHPPAGTISRGVDRLRRRGGRAR